eukprot:TRINITY_DN1436_c0_g1_i2.p1 TRINITY_DN1436_c0_g1~~TRINITY_DN1436_c0_g1_i2.p1  ORF type:complete len:100 (+),score=3.98 TRINITY_DN1436_c0_g1_i2:158-457(+)
MDMFSTLGSMKKRQVRTIACCARLSCCISGYLAPLSLCPCTSPRHVSSPTPPCTTTTTTIPPPLSQCTCITVGASGTKPGIYWPLCPYDMERYDAGLQF